MPRGWGSLVESFCLSRCFASDVHCAMARDRSVWLNGLLERCFGLAVVAIKWQRRLRSGRGAQDILRDHHCPAPKRCPARCTVFRCRPCCLCVLVVQVASTGRRSRPAIRPFLGPVRHVSLHYTSVLSPQHAHRPFPGAAASRRSPLAVLSSLQDQWAHTHSHATSATPARRCK